MNFNMMLPVLEKLKIFQISSNFFLKRNFCEPLSLVLSGAQNCFFFFLIFTMHAFDQDNSAEPYPLIYQARKSSTMLIFPFWKRSV